MVVVVGSGKSWDARRVLRALHASAAAGEELGPLWGACLAATIRHAGFSQLGEVRVWSGFNTTGPPLFGSFPLVRSGSIRRRRGNGTQSLIVCSISDGAVIIDVLFPRPRLAQWLLADMLLIAHVCRLRDQSVLSSNPDPNTVPYM